MPRAGATATCCARVSCAVVVATAAWPLQQARTQRPHCGRLVAAAARHREKRKKRRRQQRRRPERPSRPRGRMDSDRGRGIRTPPSLKRGEERGRERRSNEGDGDTEWKKVEQQRTRGRGPEQMKTNNAQRSKGLTEPNRGNIAQQYKTTPSAKTAEPTQHPITSLPT